MDATSFHPTISPIRFLAQPTFRSGRKCLARNLTQIPPHQRPYFPGRYQKQIHPPISRPSAGTSDFQSLRYSARFVPANYPRRAPNPQKAPAAHPALLPPYPALENRQSLLSPSVRRLQPVRRFAALMVSEHSANDESFVRESQWLRFAQAAAWLFESPPAPRPQNVHRAKSSAHRFRLPNHADKPAGSAAEARA